MNNANLYPCPHCNELVSITAAACPHCGARLGPPPVSVGRILLLLWIIGALVYLWANYQGWVE